MNDWLEIAPGVCIRSRVLVDYCKTTWGFSTLELAMRQAKAELSDLAEDPKKWIEEAPPWSLVEEEKKRPRRGGSEPWVISSDDE